MSLYDAENKHVAGELAAALEPSAPGHSNINLGAICDAGGNPYLRSSPKFDHLRKLSKTERISVGSAPLSMLISARPGNST